MKSTFQKLFLSVALLGLVFTGCKKDNDGSDADEATEQAVNAADESRVAGDMDAEADEANDIALDFQKFRGPNYIGIITGTHIPCNATVDTSEINIGKITVTYNGLSCNGKRNRTGTVVLQLPYDAGTSTVTPWSSAGCVLNITFSNLVITRVSDGKYITINGSKQITNVNGGLVDNSPSFSNPIVHHITGMMQITFDNNTTRTWNIDRTRSINRSNNVTTITVSGNASQGGHSNVAVWGINRKGNTFYLSIATPVVISSGCSYNATSGVRIHYGVIRDLTVTYGVDQAGNIVTSGCPYGYRLNWVNKNGVAKQVVVAY